MAIPDHIIFSIHLTEPKGITFGEVRTIKDDDTKLLYLKRRLEDYLLNQIDPISNREKVDTPFPLTVLTCVAVETLGRVVQSVSSLKKDDKKKNEISKIVSVHIYSMLDKKLSRQLSQNFKNSMKTLWPKEDISKISSYAEIFHNYLRTSFMHGYRAKNVFLKAELQEDWVFEDGFLVINPYWFWQAYKRVFQEQFLLIFDKKEKNNPIRKNALDYFHSLLHDDETGL